MSLYAPAPSIPTNIDPVPSRRGTVTTLMVGQTPSVILESDIYRKGFSIYNSGEISVYLGFLSTVNFDSNFFVKIPSQGFYEWSGNSVYTGVIFAVADDEDVPCQVAHFAAY